MEEGNFIHSSMLLPDILWDKIGTSDTIVLWRDYLLMVHALSWIIKCHCSRGPFLPLRLFTFSRRMRESFVPQQKSRGNCCLLVLPSRTTSPPTIQGIRGRAHPKPKKKQQDRMDVLLTEHWLSAYFSYFWSNASSESPRVLSGMLRKKYMWVWCHLLA